MPLVLLAALLLAPVSLDYEVLLNGAKAGDAKLVYEVRENGTKSTVLDIRFATPDGRRIETHTEGVYDELGRPLRRSQRTQLNDPWTVRLVNATFSEGGANVVVFENDRRTVRNIPLVRTAPTQDPIALWFPDALPAAGTTHKGFVLNLETLAWDLVTTTYRGIEEIAVAGTRQQTHRVESDQGTVFLDKEGLPWMVQSPSLRLVRRLGSGS